MREVPETSEDAIFAARLDCSSGTVRRQCIASRVPNSLFVYKQKPAA